MDIITFIFSAENVRTVILFITVVYGITWLRHEQEKSLDAKFKEEFANFHALLKDNDFAHLNRTIKALTFTLEKNKMLEPEDKKYIDSHLDEK